MDRELFPSHVNEWMDIIQESSDTDSQRLAEYCEKLEKYATEVRSDALMGFSLFNRGYGAFAVGRLTDSTDYLSDALTFLLADDEWEYVTRAYTVMGNIAESQGDTSLAIDCYFRGLGFCRDHDLKSGEFTILSNLASVFLSLNEYANAADMLKRCELLTESGAEIHFSSKNVLWANLSECHIQLGDLDQADIYLTRLKETYRDDFTPMDNLMVCMLEAKLSRAKNDIPACEAAIATFDHIELSTVLVLNAFSELCQYALLLLDLHKIDQFLSLVQRIKSFAKGPKAELQILSLYLNYHDKIGDQKAYAETAIRYYTVSSVLEAERNKIISHNILNRIHLEEEELRRKQVEDDNLVLKQKSERDALTGLNNRYKLNELFEQAFHQAYSNGTTLTVEILDIDCYKEFNDNYGHQAGDDCLVQIAETIRSMEEFGGVHTARYGGDEFVIIYENYTKEEIEKMAQLLADRIYHLNAEHKFSKVSDRVTISQGLFHKIPSGGNKPWDFLYGADMALYGVKRRTKNAFYIGSNFNEVREYCNEVKSAAT